MILLLVGLLLAYTNSKHSLSQDITELIMCFGIIEVILELCGGLIYLSVSN